MNEKVEKLADIAKAFPNEKVAEQALGQAAVFLTGALAVA